MIMANVNKEIMELIELVAEKSAKKAILKNEKVLVELQRLEMQKKIDYFESAKKALRIYNRLVEYTQDEELYIEKHLSDKDRPRRSKDIIRYSKTNNISNSTEDEFELRDTALEQYKKTKQFIERVEMAIDRIKLHEDFSIVKRVYIDLDRVSAKHIADEMNLGRSTLYRRLDRLVGEFKVVLFGLTKD